MPEEELLKKIDKNKDVTVTGQEIKDFLDGKNKSFLPDEKNLKAIVKELTDGIDTFEQTFINNLKTYKNELVNKNIKNLKPSEIKALQLYANVSMHETLPITGKLTPQLEELLVLQDGNYFKNIANLLQISERELIKKLRSVGVNAFDEDQISQLQTTNINDFIDIDINSYPPGTQEKVLLNIQMILSSWNSLLPNNRKRTNVGTLLTIKGETDYYLGVIEHQQQVKNLFDRMYAKKEKFLNGNISEQDLQSYLQGSKITDTKSVFYEALSALMVNLSGKNTLTPLYAERMKLGPSFVFSPFFKLMEKYSTHTGTIWEVLYYEYLTTSLKGLTTTVQMPIDGKMSKVSILTEGYFRKYPDSKASPLQEQILYNTSYGKSLLASSNAWYAEHFDTPEKQKQFDANKKIMQDYAATLTALENNVRQCQAAYETDKRIQTYQKNGTVTTGTKNLQKYKDALEDATEQLMEKGNLEFVKMILKLNLNGLDGNAKNALGITPLVLQHYTACNQSKNPNYTGPKTLPAPIGGAGYELDYSFLTSAVKTSAYSSKLYYAGDEEWVNDNADKIIRDGVMEHIEGVFVAIEKNPGRFLIDVSLIIGAGMITGLTGGIGGPLMSALAFTGSHKALTGLAEGITEISTGGNFAEGFGKGSGILTPVTKADGSMDREFSAGTFITNTLREYGTNIILFGPVGKFGGRVEKGSLTALESKAILQETSSYFTQLGLEKIGAKTIGLFAEAGLFTGFNAVMGAAQSGFDEAIWKESCKIANLAEGFVHNVCFIGALKLGNFASSPIQEKIAGKQLTQAGNNAEKNVLSNRKEYTKEIDRLRTAERISVRQTKEGTSIFVKDGETIANDDPRVATLTTLQTQFFETQNTLVQIKSQIMNKNKDFLAQEPVKTYNDFLDTYDLRRETLTPERVLDLRIKAYEKNNNTAKVAELKQLQAELKRHQAAYNKALQELAVVDEVQNDQTQRATQQLQEETQEHLQKFLDTQKKPFETLTTEDTKNRGINEWISYIKKNELQKNPELLFDKDGKQTIDTHKKTSLDALTLEETNRLVENAKARLENKANNNQAVLEKIESKIQTKEYIQSIARLKDKPFEDLTLQDRKDMGAMPEWFAYIEKNELWKNPALQEGIDITGKDSFEKFSVDEKIRVSENVRTMKEKETILSQFKSLNPEEIAKSGKIEGENQKIVEQIMSLKSDEARQEVAEFLLKRPLSTEEKVLIIEAHTRPDNMKTLLKLRELFGFEEMRLLTRWGVCGEGVEKPELIDTPTESLTSLAKDIATLSTEKEPSKASLLIQTINEKIKSFTEYVKSNFEKFKNSTLKKTFDLLLARLEHTLDTLTYELPEEISPFAFVINAGIKSYREAFSPTTKELSVDRTSDRVWIENWDMTYPDASGKLGFVENGVLHINKEKRQEKYQNKDGERKYVVTLPEKKAFIVHERAHQEIAMFSDIAPSLFKELLYTIKNSPYRDILKFAVIIQKAGLSLDDVQSISETNAASSMSDANVLNEIIATHAERRLFKKELLADSFLKKSISKYALLESNIKKFKEYFDNTPKDEEHINDAFFLNRAAYIDADIDIEVMYEHQIAAKMKTLGEEGKEFVKILGEVGDLLKNEDFAYFSSMGLFSYLHTYEALPNDLDIALNRNNKSLGELHSLVNTIQGSADKNHIADIVSIMDKNNVIIGEHTIQLERGKTIQETNPGLSPETYIILQEHLLKAGDLKVAFWIKGKEIELFPEQDFNGVTNKGSDPDKTALWIDIGGVKVPVMDAESIRSGYVPNFIVEIFNNNIESIDKIDAKAKDALRLSSLVCLGDIAGVKDLSPTGLKFFIHETIRKYENIPIEKRSTFVSLFIKKSKEAMNMLNSIEEQYLRILIMKPEFGEGNMTFTDFHSQLTQLKKKLAHTYNGYKSAETAETKAIMETNARAIMSEMKDLVDSPRLEKRVNRYAFIYEKVMVEQYFIKPVEKLLAPNTSHND